MRINSLKTVSGANTQTPAQSFKMIVIIQSNNNLMRGAR